ncbi:DUF559 domain-containing protein [Candidatus Woesearchaeota archaeon]|nr:DUF559 domain-containing protein [Candidatus Woesearchaeota archaeon]
MHSIKGGKERGKQLKLDPEHQSKSGRKGGEKTIQLHPEQSINNWSKNNLELQSRISSETVRRTHQNDPTLASRMGKSTYQKHPELASKIAKKTHQKYPNLASRMGKSTHLRHPEQASMMGKISYQKHPGDNLRKAELFFEKHPDFRSNVAKKTHQKMKENDPEGYSKKQTDAMPAGSKGKTKPEKIMGDILPNDFVYNQHFICGAPDFRSESRKIIIQVDGPRHYKTMGKFYDKEKVIKTQEKDKRQEIRWAEEGYKVYRFTDIEINKEKDKVAERVKKILSI